MIRMSEVTPQQFRAAFVENVRYHRVRSGHTQERMATALGLDVHAYRKYELRSPVPHHLIPLFCMICGIAIDDLFRVQNVRSRRKREIERSHVAA